MAIRDKPVPEWTQSGDVRTGPALSSAGPPPLQHFSTPEEFMAFDDQSAEALERGLNSAANTVQGVTERQEKMWVLNQVSEAKTQWNTRLKSEFYSGKATPTDQLMSEYTQYAQGMADKAPSGRARDLLVDHFDAMAPVYARQSVMANARARVMGNNNQLGSLIQMLGGDSTNSPDMPNVRSNLKIGQIGIRDSGADAQTKSAAQDGLDKMAHDAAWNDASSNPAAGVQKIDAGHYDGLVHPDTLAGWRPQLLQAAELGKNAAKWQSDQAYENLLHTTKFNGPQPDQDFFVKAYAMAHGKEADAALLKATSDFSYANTFYKAQAPLDSMPSNKIDSYLESFRPADDDPNYTTNLKLYNELSAYAYGGKGKGAGKNEAFGYSGLLNDRANDPFGYGLENSVPLRSANAAVMDAVGKINADPTKSAEMMPQLQQAHTKLVQDSLVYQSSLGIPLAEQQVMSKQDAENYATKLQNATDVKGVLQATKEIQTLFGGYYPMAVKAMQSLPDEGKRLGAGYTMLLANADNPVLTQKLATSLARPEKDVRSILQEGDSTTGNKDMLTAINGNPEFAAWKAQQRAMGANAQSESFIADTQAGLRKLTAQYVAEGQDVPAAASKAASDIFSNNYQSVRVHTTNLLPWTWGNGGEKVLAARNDEMGRAYPQEFLDGLGARLDHEKAALTDLTPEVRANSKWVSMPDNQGVYLLHTNELGQPQLVQGAGGAPLTKRFSDMLTQSRVAARDSMLSKASIAVQPQNLIPGVMGALTQGGISPAQ